MARPRSALGNLPPPPGGAVVVHKKKSSLLDSSVWERLKSAELEVQQSLDELNRELARAEEALDALPVKWAASVEIEEAGPTSPGVTTLLSFHEATHRKWGLFVESGPDDGPEFWDEQPLSQASRKLRVKAAEALPRLLEEMIASAEAENVRIRRAKKRAAEFVAFMSKGGNDDAKR